jgi:hypothetical protein
MVVDPTITNHYNHVIDCHPEADAVDVYPEISSYYDDVAVNLRCAVPRVSEKVEEGDATKKYVGTVDMCHCVYGVLFTVHCSLFTVHCTLYTVHCTLYTVHCTRFTVYDFMYLSITIPTL